MAGDSYYRLKELGGGAHSDSLIWHEVPLFVK
jgi:hypothetical protein